VILADVVAEKLAHFAGNRAVITVDVSQHSLVAWCGSSPGLGPMWCSRPQAMAASTRA
jgi:hypothetical protein